ncbi:MAG: 1,2-phenylacetyl-CoA epoxidase subunit PaaE [Chitinophagales bacterium]
MATHFRKLKIKDLRKETENCVSISFEIPPEWRDEFQFHHGQNITLRKTLDGEELRRSYSICSSPLEDELRIAVKKMEYGKFSSHVNQEFRAGDMIDVLPPTGKFFTRLDATKPKNYLALVAGCGITPVLSIIKTTLASEPKSSFTLVYGNRDRHSIIFREALEALKNMYMDRFSLIHILSREKTEAPINEGRIDIDKCKSLFEKLIDLNKTDEIFICGPEEMIFSLSHFLGERTYPKDRIHFELFTVPGQKSTGTTIKTRPPRSNNGEESLVSITLDGISFSFDLPYDGETILDAALKTGADLPFACKGGVCASCRAKLIEGKVEMENNYALEKDELEAGFILTCQSHPRSPTLRIDFDKK